MLGQIGQIGRMIGQIGTVSPSKGGGAAQYASAPAPSGFRWDFVTSNGVRVALDNEPVVALVRAA